MQKMAPEDISVEGMDFEPKVEAWMKEHTVGEIKALAHEIEDLGEGADEIEEFYADLRSIEKDFVKHKQHGHYAAVGKVPDTVLV
ncbi:MAG TPA: hypothetical protein VMS79_01155 [Methanomassiliicoccales archaeon]|jgi:hypothetical protein|nr:hypothetical protein [Methanomassiliicoccales archaeon]